MRNRHSRKCGQFRQELVPYQPITKYTLIANLILYGIDKYIEEEYREK